MARLNNKDQSNSKDKIASFLFEDIKHYTFSRLKSLNFQSEGEIKKHNYCQSKHSIKGETYEIIISVNKVNYIKP